MNPDDAQRNGVDLRGDVLELVISAVEREEPIDGYTPLRLVTNRGPIDCRLYEPDPRLIVRHPAAVVWAPGAIGGFHSPAHGLYDRAIAGLVQRGVRSMRVRFRHAHDLLESALDVLAASAYLQSQGAERLGFVGHSFGGAVVIQAAAQQPLSKTIVTIATQSYGAEAVSLLPAECSILLLHGSRDDVLPEWCSRLVEQMAHGHKRLVLYPGADHNLDQVVRQAESDVTHWLLSELAEEPSCVERLA